MIKSKKIVLMYHDVLIEDSSESGFKSENAYQYKVYENNFEQQVIAISKLGCKDSVEFTFDDGGVSFYTIIAPILEKYGFKGIFFISTQYINTNGFLTDKQIKELHDRGHIIGSHSHSHPLDMSLLKECQIKEEWEISQNILSKIIGREVTIASIPNGYASDAIYKAAQKQKYNCLYTSKPTDRATHLQDISFIGRYVIHNTTSTDDVIQIVSNKSTRLKFYYRWLVLSIVKRILGSNYNKVKSAILKKLR